MKRLPSKPSEYYMYRLLPGYPFEEKDTYRPNYILKLIFTLNF